MLVTQNAFKPYLYESPAFAVTDEQKARVREVLRIISSDSQFAEKGYNALVSILTDGSVVPATITSLNPSTAVVGDRSFTLTVTGAGFTNESVIFWNDSPQDVTNFIDGTQLSTLINMNLGIPAGDVPVKVQNVDGSMSEPTIFTLTAPPITKVVEAKKEEPKKELKKEEEKEKKNPFDFTNPASPR